MSVAATRRPGRAGSLAIAIGLHSRRSADDGVCSRHPCARRLNPVAAATQIVPVAPSNATSV